MTSGSSALTASVATRPAMPTRRHKRTSGIGRPDGATSSNPMKERKMIGSDTAASVSKSMAITPYRPERILSHKQALGQRALGAVTGSDPGGGRDDEGPTGITLPLAKPSHILDFLALLCQLAASAPLASSGAAHFNKR